MKTDALLLDAKNTNKTTIFPNRILVRKQFLSSFMKIFVCIKQVPDTETKIKLSGDSQSIDTNGVKWIMNPYDEFMIHFMSPVSTESPLAET